MKKRFPTLVIGLTLALIGSMLTGCGNAAAGKSANRLEAILHRGYIEVATEPAFAPNEFIDPTKPEGEKYVGSDIELARYIAKELGVELRIVPLEFSAVLAGISEGKYDLAISALAYKPDRAQAMTLSKGYHFSKENAGHTLLIRTENQDQIKSPDDLSGKTIVYQSGSLQELFVNEQMPKDMEHKRVSATTDGFLMVQEGKADACATSVKTAELYIAANPDAGLMLLEDFRFTLSPEMDGTRIGMPKDEPELEAKINALIDQVLADGLYETWYEQYSQYAAKLGL